MRTRSKIITGFLISDILFWRSDIDKENLGALARFKENFGDGPFVPFAIDDVPKASRCAAQHHQFVWIRDKQGKEKRFSGYWFEVRS